MNYSINLDPNTTPLLDQWKKSQLDKVSLYGIPLESIEKLDFKVISDMIREHECEQIELTKRIAEVATAAPHANENHFIDDYEQKLIVKAIDYNIPLPSNLLEINWADLEDTVEALESLITEAKEVGIDWTLYGDDYISLRADIEEAMSEEYSSYARGVRHYYNSTRL